MPNFAFLAEREVEVEVQGETRKEEVEVEGGVSPGAMRNAEVEIREVKERRNTRRFIAVGSWFIDFCCDSVALVSCWGSSSTVSRSMASKRRLACNTLSMLLWNRRFNYIESQRL